MLYADNQGDQQNVVIRRIIRVSRPKKPGNHLAIVQ